MAFEPRGSKILFKTEIAQAIISADRAVLIKGRRERDAAHLAAEIMKARESGGGGGVAGREWEAWPVAGRTGAVRDEWGGVARGARRPGLLCSSTMQPAPHLTQPPLTPPYPPLSHPLGRGLQQLRQRRR
jgi:hypothetical protein